MTNPLAFHQVAELVLDCVCDQMTAIADAPPLGFTYPGCPCRTYVSPGPPAFDNCCQHCGSDEVGGQLTVHINDVFESSSFPERTGFIHPCAPNALVVNLVVTTVRCIPTVDDSGRDPLPEAIQASAAVGHADLWAMLVGLQCCVTAEPPAGRKRRLVFVSGLGPVGEAAGGCMGFQVAASVALGPECICEQGSS